MQLRLVAIDKIRSPFVADACNEFRKRLAPYVPFEECEVRAGHGSDPQAAMREEAERILKLIRPGEPLWLLERTGTQLSSIELSERLGTLDRTGVSRATIVIAGTYGAAPELIARATFLWSLSQLTFLHEWARAIVLEQLYRAAKIARNEPYHH